MASLARQSDDLPQRVEQLARAGRAAMQLGKEQRDIGRRWIDEAARLIPVPDFPDADSDTEDSGVRNIGDMGFDAAECEVAWGTAYYDPGRALLLLSQVDDAKQRTYLPRLAIAGCVTDLEESLRIVSEIKGGGAGFGGDQSHIDKMTQADVEVEMAYRLAATQPDRAVKLFEEATGEHANAPPSQLAMALAPHHRDLAISILGRTVPTGIERVTGDRLLGIWRREAGDAESIAPAVTIGCPEMEDAVWRALASLVVDISVPRAYSPVQPSGWEVVALLDREAARPIFDAANRLARLVSSSSGYNNYHKVSALVDLKRAGEVFDRQLADVKAVTDARMRAESLERLISETEDMATILASPSAERLQNIASPNNRLPDDD